MKTLQAFGLRGHVDQVGFLPTTQRQIVLQFAVGIDRFLLQKGLDQFGFAILWQGNFLADLIKDAGLGHHHG